MTLLRLAVWLVGLPALAVSIALIAGPVRVAYWEWRFKREERLLFELICPEDPEAGRRLFLDVLKEES